MSRYRLELGRSAQRDLRALDKSIAKSIVIAIDELSVDPRPADMKALKGQHKGTFRIAVRTDWRILYTIDDTERVVAIVRVVHRREAY